MDVNTAFLNSPIDETVYVRQPPCFLDAQHPDYVWKLKGAMYGLKQAPLLWNQHINATLSKLGFRRHEGEYGLYFKKCPEGLVLVALYVDDQLIAAASSRLVSQVKQPTLYRCSQGLCRHLTRYTSVQLTVCSSTYIPLALTG